MTKRREYEATNAGLLRGFVTVCIAIVIAVILIMLAETGGP